MGREILADDIRASLVCGRQSCDCTRGGNVHCPVHGDDKHPSLSIRDGHTAPTVKCFKGCDSQSIIAKLREIGAWPERVQQPQRYTREPVAVYRYMDADGVLVGEKGRFEFYRDGERTKTFLWRLPSSDTWGGLGGKLMPLYNLPAVIDHPEATVWFVEGEKAAQSLINRGLVAVCGYAGASQREWGDSLDYLLGRQVILWPDNDDPGYSLMGMLLRHIPDAVLLRPDVPEKADAYDFFEAGGTVSDLCAMTGTVATYIPAAGRHGVSVGARSLFKA